MDITLSSNIFRLSRKIRARDRHSSTEYLPKFSTVDLLIKVAGSVKRYIILSTGTLKGEVSLYH
jgi:hypothetical protein